VNNSFILCVRKVKGLKINRTQMMRQHGLECINIQWSWIFVNHNEKFIVVQNLMAVILYLNLLGLKLLLEIIL